MRIQQGKKLSLFQLARRRTLPRWQNMDQPTLLWINKNNPWGKRKIRFPRADKSYNAVSYIPKGSWLQHPRGWDSIHGVRHSIRVIIFAGLMSRVLRCTVMERSAAMTAASLHDIRRRNDKGDAGHARRAGTWFRQHATLVAKSFGLEYSAAWSKYVEHAIISHEQPMTVRSVAQMTPAQKVLTVLECADALDRYRLPKKKWWPNEDLVPVSIPEPIKHFAYRLVVRSEALFLVGDDSVTSVLRALRLMYEN